MDFSIFSQPIEKRTINWKDPQVKQLLDDFINGKLPLRNIPEFANYINKVCNTSITLSTIRNRVYQEQRERKLLLKGMQVAASFPSTSSPTTGSLTTSLPGTPKTFESTAPPDPEPVSVLQAVPVMLRGDDGNEILQGYAIMGDANQVIMLPEGMQINSEITQPSTALTVPQQPPPTVVSPLPSKVPKRKKSPHQQQLQLPKLEETTVELTDEPLDDWRPELDAFYTQPEPKKYKGPEAPATHKLPSEFLQHFNADTFRVDMDSLKQLSIFVREKVEYLDQATEVFPNHNSFINNTNADAFKRNLDVIKQAGDYFEPLLAFETDPKFFPNALSEIGQAISICAENGTAMVDQFQRPSIDKLTLPGSSLTKNGMTNLCILLHGILLEAEALITEYDKLKQNRKVNKVKMMMLTLQFARYYKLAGEIAKAAMISTKNKALTEQLNKLSIIKLDGILEEDEEETSLPLTASIIAPKEEPSSNVIELSDSPDVLEIIQSWNFS